MFGKSELEKKVNSMTARIDGVVSQVNILIDRLALFSRRLDQLEASQQFSPESVDGIINTPTLPVVSAQDLKAFSGEAFTHLYNWTYKVSGDYKNVCATNPDLSQYMHDCLRGKALSTHARKEFLRACEHFGIK